MKIVFFVIVMLVSSISAFSQSSTVVNLYVDQYEWNKLMVSHFFDKENGIGAQVWYKKTNATKRVRVFYQRKFSYAKGNNNIQFISGVGLQGTSRKRSSISYQFYVPADLQYKYKINKDWSMNARAITHFSLSPKASQGDHTNKTTTDFGFKYQKTGFLYRGEYISAFKTGIRNNFQGGGLTYDATKKLTLGVVIYTDLKESKKKVHPAFTANYRF